MADTEQDVGNARGQDRGYVLPDLARAAVGAGAREKALAYANEMLQRAEQNVAHDVNSALLTSILATVATEHLLESRGLMGAIGVAGGLRSPLGGPISAVGPHFLDPAIVLGAITRDLKEDPGRARSQ